MEIAGFVKNSFVDYPSNIAATIFTCGCNMNCWYCHNRDLITANNGEYDADKILEFLKSRKSFLDGVVITGGEPTLQADLKEYVKKIKDLGLLVKLDTNGTSPSVLKQLIDENLLDYIAMDIKAPFSKYNTITKVENIDNIKQSINLIKNSGLNYEFRTTFAPTLTVDDIKQLLMDINGCDVYSLQQYKQPSFITNTTLKNHTKQEFELLKEFSKPYVKLFNIKNI